MDEKEALALMEQAQQVATRYGACLITMSHDGTRPLLHAVPDRFRLHAFPLTDTEALAQLRLEKERLEAELQELRRQVRRSHFWHGNPENR